MKIAPPWRFILRAPSLTPIQIERRSPPRRKEGQSCFPQILQGLGGLTRPKTFEVDVGMARRCQPRYFQTEETRQSSSPDKRIGDATQAPPSTIPPCPMPLLNWPAVSESSGIAPAPPVRE